MSLLYQGEGRGAYEGFPGLPKNSKHKQSLRASEVPCPPLSLLGGWTGDTYEGSWAELNNKDKQNLQRSLRIPSHLKQGEGPELRGTPRFERKDRAARGKQPPSSDGKERERVEGGASVKA